MREANVSEDLEVDFYGHPAGDGFAVQSGWLEAVALDGFDGFGFHGVKGVVVFLAFIGQSGGLDYLDVAEVTVCFNDKLHRNIGADLSLAGLFGELGLDGVDELRCGDAIADVVDAVCVGIGTDRGFLR